MSNVQHALKSFSGKEMLTATAENLSVVETGDTRGKYQNLAQSTTRATAAKRATAIRALNAFLAEMSQKEPSEFAISRIEDAFERGAGNGYAMKDGFTQTTLEDILGKFADYLTKQENSKGKTKSYSTVAGYSSVLNQWLREVYRVQIDTSFVKSLRASVRRTHTERSKNTGEPLVEHAPLMTKNDLEVFSELLLKENCMDALEVRACMVLQWHCLGRVGEAASLNCGSFKLQSETDSVSMMVRR